MRIDYIKLTGFIPFVLRYGEVFECHFTAKLAMIAGPNGAGKSMLLHELTALPAERSKYHPGGSKVVHISNDGKSYIIVSSFVGSPKYSFECDGVELNASGNASAQRELAYQHFGITAAIHELMTGGESFTTMSLPGRKKLFNSVTHLNIDHILQSYESLKDELKNNEYLVKTLQTRLIAEEDKLIDTSRRQMLSNKLELLQTHIEGLLEIRTELHQHRTGIPHHDAVLSYESACNALKAHYGRHLVSLTAYPLSMCSEREIHLTKDLSTLSQTLQGCYATMEKLLHERDSIAFAQQHSRQTTLEQIDSATSACANLIDHLRLFDKDTPHLPEISAELNLLECSLPDILETLEPNPDKQLSKSAHERLLAEKNAIIGILHERMQEYTGLTTQLKQLQSHQQLTCPACTHSWLPSEVNGLLTTTTQRIAAIDSERLTLQEKVTALSAELERQSNYLTQMHRVATMYNGTKNHLAPLWKVVTTDAILYENPAALLTLVGKGIVEVGDIQKYRQYQERLEVLRGELALMDTAATANGADNAKAIADTEARISSLMDDIEHIRDAIEDVRFAARQHTRLQELQSQAQRAAAILQTSQLKYTVDKVVAEIDAELSMTKVSVIEIQNELTQHSNIEKNIQTLNEQIKEAAEAVKVLTCLTEELSPKNGFIAKTISNFLNVIIANVNSGIAGVWDYKMVLKPIDVGSDALNYRFKLEVEDRTSVDDVSKASKGMQEMINLAMRMTLRGLLKLQGYPMYLDEFGANLDAVHRARSTDIIFGMISNPRYEQIFLVTHLDLAYADFRDTQVVTL